MEGGKPDLQKTTDVLSTKIRRSTNAATHLSSKFLISKIPRKKSLVFRASNSHLNSLFPHKRSEELRSVVSSVNVLPAILLFCETLTVQYLCVLPMLRGGYTVRDTASTDVTHLSPLPKVYPIPRAFIVPALFLLAAANEKRRFIANVQHSLRSSVGDGSCAGG